MLPTEDTQVDHVVNPLVQRELQEGEHLLWWSQPDPKRSATHNGTRTIVRSVQVLVALDAILMLLAVISFFVPIGPFKSTHLLSLLFVIGAVALTAFSLPKKLSRYRAARQQEHTLAHTIYAITNHRVLILIKADHREGVNAHSFTKGDFGRIERFEQDGWGDLVFGPIRPLTQGKAQLAPRLAGIANVRRVEGILLKTFKEGEGTIG